MIGNILPCSIFFRDTFCEHIRPSTSELSNVSLDLRLIGLRMFDLEHVLRNARIIMVVVQANHIGICEVSKSTVAGFHFWNQ